MDFVTIALAIAALIGLTVAAYRIPHKKALRPSFVGFKQGSVAIVTGANAGIGLALAELLLRDGVHVVMGCRNENKGKRAMAELRRAVPGAKVELLVVDMGKPKSVLRAVREFRASHKRLDHIFCNAGIFPTNGYNLGRAFTLLTDPVGFFETSNFFIRQPAGLKTEDGIAQVFATNVLGHYLLIRELEDMVARQGGRVVWTGSRSSSDKFIDWSDITHMDGPHPYQTSKHVVDVLTHALNDKYKKDGTNVTVFSTCPGGASTSMQPRVAYAFLWCLGWYIKSLVMSTYKAAEVMFLLGKVDLGAVSPYRKYAMYVEHMIPIYYGGEIGAREKKAVWDTLEQFRAKFSE